MLSTKCHVFLLGVFVITFGNMSVQISGEGPVCPLVADIVLILDESTSIIAAQGGYDNWNKYTIGFALGLARAFTIGPRDTQMAVIKFNAKATPAIYFNQSTNYKALEAEIKQLKITAGQTNIADALRQTRNVMFSPSHGARTDVDRIAILVTDGKTSVESSNTLNEADITKQSGIELFAVGMTNYVDVDQLKAIVSSPFATHYFYVNDYSKLALIIQDIISKSCITRTISIQSTSITTTPTEIIAPSAASPTASTFSTTKTTIFSTTKTTTTTSSINEMTVMLTSTTTSTEATTTTPTPDAKPITKPMSSIIIASIIASIGPTTNATPPTIESSASKTPPGSGTATKTPFTTENILTRTPTGKRITPFTRIASVTNAALTTATTSTIAAAKTTRGRRYTPNVAIATPSSATAATPTTTPGNAIGI